MSDCDRYIRRDPNDVAHLEPFWEHGDRPALHLIEPDLGRVSGGLRYNESLAAGADELLHQTGVIQRHSVPGNWPHPSTEDEAAVHELAATLDAPVVVDGLIGSALRTPLDLDVPVIQLIHAILAESDPAALDRERANMHAADAVVTTSPHAVRTLKQLTGIWASVARPGVDLRPVTEGSPDGNRFICVGAVEPNKNQLFLTEVFAALAVRGLTDWHVTFAGPHTDPDYAARLVRACEQLPPGTTTVTGELTPAEVDELYRTSDLLLLPSVRETYGMVVTEAAAAGLPSVVTEGTGAEDARVVGALAAPEVTEWADILEGWLTQPYRHDLQRQAVQARKTLYRWQDTADDLFRAVHAISHRTERTP
ncbi:glycosyltransferase family 4 protein [Micrococcus terreus]|uniref:glycosyltransferase family 4 protein n=1 Tax=Micrococcus terreus TaxID=574650 RepID=UPI0021A32D91|nr:glycosyltransferase family 4 protein [Micrococcus terreus]MCT2089754.1 glycosyltransferase family 4 protein [Micrococcus terreus]